MMKLTSIIFEMLTVFVVLLSYVEKTKAFPIGAVTPLYCKDKTILLSDLKKTKISSLIHKFGKFKDSVKDPQAPVCFSKPRFDSRLLQTVDTRTFGFEVVQYVGKLEALEKHFSDNSAKNDLKDIIKILKIKLKLVNSCDVEANGSNKIWKTKMWYKVEQINQENPVCKQHDGNDNGKDINRKRDYALVLYTQKILLDISKEGKL